MNMHHRLQCMHLMLHVAPAQVTALDFGPVGEADVTANLMESVPCGPVVHEHADVLNQDDAHCLPFLRIDAPHHPAGSPVLAQVRSVAWRS